MSEFVLPKPHAKQSEFLADTHRYKVLNWGRRSGKSVIVWEKVVLDAMLRQGLYYIVCPTYKQAKEIYWRDICKRYSAPFMHYNEQELSITFDHLHGIEIPTNAGLIKVNHDVNLPPSRIALKGADNPESLRGVGLCGVVLDEFAFMPHGQYTYDTIIRPQLGDRDGWSVFISTPNGVVNHFYELYLNAQRRPDKYFYSHATALDNPHFPKKEFKETRQEYEEAGKLDQFNQEWMAEFTNPQALVFGKFDMDTHLYGRDHPIKKAPEEGQWCLAIDFGMTDPTAILNILIDYEGNWWVTQEVYQVDLHLDQLVSIMHDMMGDRHYARIVGDGAARFELESLRKRRFRITGSKKGADSLANGIQEIRSLLEVREGTGKPKIFVNQNCKNLVREFMSYSFLRDGDGELTNVPEDKNNHALDALRYLALAKATPVKRQRKVKHYDEVTGRLLS